MNSAHKICTNWKQCPECKLTFAHTRNLYRHFREAHPSMKEELKNNLKIVKKASDMAEKPKKHVPPPEARLKPKKKMSTNKPATKSIIEMDLTLSSDSEEEPNTEIKLNKNDKKLLREFLIVPELDSTPTKKKKKMTKPVNTTNSSGMNTEAMALTMREILAYIDTAIWADYSNVELIQERLDLRKGTYKPKHRRTNTITTPRGYEIKEVIEIDYIKAIEEM